MGPIVGEKFFWGNCSSKTLCKSQPDRHIQKRGGIPQINPDTEHLFGLRRVPWKSKKPALGGLL
jgi:hypothetical protein